MSQQEERQELFKLRSLLDQGYNLERASFSLGMKPERALELLAESSSLRASDNDCLRIQAEAAIITAIDALTSICKHTVNPEFKTKAASALLRFGIEARKALSGSLPVGGKDLGDGTMQPEIWSFDRKPED